MKLSASQAAKETGKSIPTITRAINSGKLSARKLDGGGYEIDPAELFRVFDPVTAKQLETPNELPDATPNQTKALEVEVKLLRELLDREREALADVAKDRDHWRQQATALLTDQRERPTPSRSWWPFRRSND